MVKGVLRGGVIQPVSPIPESWAEGQELIIEEAAPAPEEDLDTWAREVREMASKIPLEEFDRLEAALAEADRQAKDLMRRRMGL